MRFESSPSAPKTEVNMKYIAAFEREINAIYAHLFLRTANIAAKMTVARKETINICSYTEKASN